MSVLSPLPGTRDTGWRPAPVSRPVPGAWPRPGAPGRDGAIDAVRASCLLVVVVLHALMVGAERTAHGGLSTSVALSGHDWFVPVSWVIQVMPLFFIAGGFAGLSQWRRMRARGASASDYVRDRTRRLAVPAAAMILSTGAALTAATALGADGRLVAEAGHRIGQPLWFLAVYLGVTALVPVMAWLHENHRVPTLAVLGAGVLAVDLLRIHADLPVGYANLALLWPLMQQLGFLLADGACTAWTRSGLWCGAGAALAGTGVLVASGWSADMLVNLNPPTAALALLGVIQFFGLQLMRPSLDRLMTGPGATVIARVVSAHAMTVYLWHMPLVLLLTALVWALGLPLPEPHAAGWWITRLPWLIAVAALVIPAAHLLVGLERWGTGAGLRVRGCSRRTPVVVLAVVLAIAGVALALVAGVAAPVPVACATGLLAVSVLLSLRWDPAAG